MQPMPQTSTDTTQGEPLTLTVTIPCYNERDTIAPVLRKVLNVGLAREIIIVDDGSTDGTRAILAEIEAEGYPGVRIIYHEKNQGKGAALATAFKEAKGDIILILDADHEFDPR